ILREGKNPLCGDEVKVTLDLEGDTIERIMFDGRGCAISQSSASMMTDTIEGMTLAEAGAHAEPFKRTMQGSHEFDEDELGEVAALLGVRKFPVRVKCATLAWNALQQGLEEYAARH